ncbi:MAG: GNAT family N-acetyltransferase [Nitrosospira sp.]|jgi:RimJ/RimL family protein N-acetyltransferase|nr:GNAT family N-acetyltransferase [Nitrosospira sp.]MDW7643302.1 GNAT family protein [Nitrosomonadaceae bacterium]MBI0407125.1 GNAT family N-acetyltransferase [Nitrosospira sp.]MBI0414112.1 GNAT family N-acetyltransferase [Nitrosospira sp.]MBI0415449.1 GNAT family N-acetyltransferase [Nitrosospira sp.]
MSWLEKTEFTGQIVTLEPINLDHVEPLRAAVRDGELWKLWFANVPSPDQMENYVECAMRDTEKGGLAFAVRLKETKKIVGSTRFYNVDELNKRPMIGYTWYAKSACRTGVNRESKFLLLEYIFEEKGAIAVEFRTHYFNQPSRSAIERLGAKQDGILRNHQITSNGSIRDTVTYSILRQEWPLVKRNLLNKIV